VGDVIVPDLGKKQMPGTKCSSGRAGKFPPGRGCGCRRGRAGGSRSDGADTPTPRAACAAARCRRPGGCPPPVAKHRRSNSGEWPGCGDRCPNACRCLCAGQRAGWDGGRQTRPGCRHVPAAGERHRSGGRGGCQRAGGNPGAQLGSGQVAPLKTAASAQQLSSGGHPEITLACAGCWPQRADEPRARVMALSKFGTSSNLTGTTSIEQGEQPEPFGKGRRWQG
jgi:hypothetical protein